MKKGWGLHSYEGEVLSKTRPRSTLCVSVIAVVVHLQNSYVTGVKQDSLYNIEIRTVWKISVLTGFEIKLVQL